MIKTVKMIALSLCASTMFISCHSKSYYAAMTELKANEQIIENASSFDELDQVSGFWGFSEYLNGDEAAAVDNRARKTYERYRERAKEVSIGTYFLVSESGEQFKLELSNGMAKLYKNGIVHRKGEWDLPGKPNRRLCGAIRVNFTDGPIDYIDNHGNLTIYTSSQLEKGNWNGEIDFKDNSNNSFKYIKGTYSFSK